ncbi:DcrB-related protein [Serratia plymuthica]|uniref:DUF1795 domain-containing protein n=1 Tax=Serratia plymuthica TaxID=82996 RepID=A0A318NX80_SERPL|nr:DcrB-related protein [Serratia plymuthica]AGO56786.1 hypothetical protein SOD_c38340 [Serratia plymuthica 4Rx13]PYD36852.1 DUF1795 domain-containing protein [Serratia plymuthica]RMN20325.1 hypothetical protein ALQ63_00780 [Serratia plymuthica]
MDNTLVCLEGTLDFEEEIRNQAINIISFRQGQQITINRDRILVGHSFYEHMSLQISNAQKILNQFNFVKMDEVNDEHLFSETIQVIFTFVSEKGERVWQVTFASLINKQDIMNFTCVYADRESMEREIGRLRRCVRKFVLSKDTAH